MYEHEFLPIAKAASALGINTQQLRYARQNPAYNADEAEKPNPAEPRSKLIHLPTVSKYVAKSANLDTTVLQRMAQQTRIITADTTPNADADIEAIADVSLDPSPEAEVAEMRRKKEYWAAIRERVAAQKESGKLIEMDAAITHIATCFSAFQDAVMAVPERLCELLASETSSHVIQQELTKELIDACESAGRNIKSGLKT